MPKLAEALARNIKRLRMMKHLSQAELADLVGVSRQTIVTYENGAKGGISAGTIADLANALEVEETDLVSVPVYLEGDMTELNVYYPSPVHPEIHLKAPELRKTSLRYTTKPPEDWKKVEFGESHNPITLGEALEVIRDELRDAKGKRIEEILEKMLPADYEIASKKK